MYYIFQIFGLTLFDYIYLIHVKHASGAALRSLFAQGFVSSKLYSDDDEFKNKVIQNDFSGPDESEHQILVNVLSELQNKHKRQIGIIYAIYDDISQF